MFGLQKNLTDLVRGIRTNKKNESQYISQALQEIREELRSPEAQKKTVAVQKLTYLQMLGYDMSWAAFNIIEVMSQPKFTPKRIGYLAASQSFNEKTEVITLVTNLIRKDMTSSNVWESGIALNCLSNICTPDLARDLAADVVSLLSSSKPYIRKKACLVLYKVFLKFPDALRPSFPRLKEKLEDPDQAVVAASVNVICELARKNPKNYIALAPTLFKILTTSTNNWVLIKIVKLFANLLPIEPRLGPKLVQPLTNLINNTPAVSLLYECIQACTVGLHEHLPTIKLCISKLRNFVEDPDQNLKYLGLISLSNIMKIHPKAVGEHRDLVVNCLDDEDISIRLRALDLLEGMVSKKNVLDIVRKLLDQIDKTDSQTYKDALVDKIITICSKNSYAAITDFEWYISVLMELAHVNTMHGELIANQLMDVVIRVQVVRPFGVKSMVTLLRDITFFAENLARGGNCEVLYSAAWVTGEFASTIADPTSVIESLLQPKVAQLPSHIQSVYMQAVLKIFSYIVSSDSYPSPSPFKKNLIETEDDIVGQATPTPAAAVDTQQIDDVVQVLHNRLPLFSSSEHLEVQERACFVLEVVNLYRDLRTSGISVAQEIASLFDEPLNPVNPKAQKKVPVPEDLDLDSWINEPEPEPSTEIAYDKGFDFISKYDDEEEEKKEESTFVQEKIPKGPTTIGTSKSSPWYLGSGGGSPTSGSFENIPTVTLTAEDLGLGKGESPSSLSHKERIRKAKPKRHTPHVTVLKDDDLPPGALDSDSDKEDSSSNNPFANINFNEPLRPEEKLYVPTHRVTTTTAPTKATTEKKKKTKSTTDKTKKKRKEKKEEQAPVVNLIDIEGTGQAGFEELSSPVERKEKKKKSSSTGEKKKKSTKSKKSESATTSAPKPAPTSPAPSSAAPKTIPKFKPLCQDENLSVIYELRVNPKQPKKIMSAFMFKNLSPNQISAIQFTIPSSMNAKVSNENQCKVPLVLQPGDTNTHNVIFDIASIQSPQRISGSISYEVGGNSATKEFQLLVPVSAYVLPIKLTKEEFIEVLTQGGPFSMASTSLKCEEDLRAFLVSLATLLHVELIIFESAASLYGKTVQGQHVAVYVKPGNGSVSVDLKCSDNLIAQALVNELNSFFPRA